ncbi:MAG: hypothetical protein GY839_19480 [candidate division Zixibacteria bacterium]|nr:hypothetical protein [candidate division Zixibacteria bacterium]
MSYTLSEKEGERYGESTQDGCDSGGNKIAAKSLGCSPARYQPKPEAHARIRRWIPSRETLGVDVTIGNLIVEYDVD